jgi:anti-anti-sigma factor
MTIATLKLEGRLDTAQTAKIELAFTARVGALSRPGALAIIDLSDVTYISSMGLRLLVVTLKQFQNRGVRFATVPPREALAMESLHIANLLPLLNVADSHDAASARLTESAS